jgi:hypothetical protein
MWKRFAVKRAFFDGTHGMGVRYGDHEISPCATLSRDDKKEEEVSNLKLFLVKVWKSR